MTLDSIKQWPRRATGRSLERLWAQLSPRRRHQLFLVLGSMFAGAIAEVASLGAIVPFLAIMANPEAINNFPLVRDVLAALGIVSRWSVLAALTAAFALAAVLSAAFRILVTWVTNRFAFLIGHDLGTLLYHRVLHQPYQWHVQRNSSDTLADMQKVQTVTAGMILPLMQAASSLLMGLFIVAALILVEPVVTMAAFAGFGVIYVSISYFSRKKLTAAGEIVAKTTKERIQSVQEGVGGIRDIILDGSQPHFIARFRQTDRKLRDAQATSNLIGTTPRFVVEALGMVLVACFALYLTSNGGLTAALPILGAIALGAQRLLPLMQIGYTGWTRVIANGPALEDVLIVLERPLAGDKTELMQALPFRDNLAFKNVSFRYSASTAPVFEGLTFDITKGSRLGIFGKTGGGKSTLVDILMGLLEPTTGHVEVDGQVLDSAKLRAWQRQIAHVPQAIFLADTSIAANIAFGVETNQIDMDLVRDAARRAELAEFIDALPQGYETPVGDRGVRLSGGQRQRLGIARALFKKASVLVFDEATSALDSETEAAVMHAIDGLARDLTVIIIAHRLSTLKGCDRLLRLDKAGYSWETHEALAEH